MFVASRGAFPLGFLDPAPLFKALTSPFIDRPQRYLLPCDWFVCAF